MALDHQGVPSRALTQRDSQPLRPQNGRGGRRPLGLRLLLRRILGSRSRAVSSAELRVHTRGDDRGDLRRRHPAAGRHGWADGRRAPADARRGGAAGGAGSAGSAGSGGVRDFPSARARAVACGARAGRAGGGGDAAADAPVSSGAIAPDGRAPGGDACGPPGGRCTIGCPAGAHERRLFVNFVNAYAPIDIVNAHAAMCAHGLQQQ